MANQKYFRGNGISFSQVSPETLFCRLKDWDENLGAEGLDNIFKKRGNNQKAIVSFSQRKGKIAGSEVSFEADEEVIIIHPVSV